MSIYVCLNCGEQFASSKQPERCPNNRCRCGKPWLKIIHAKEKTICPKK